MTDNLLPLSREQLDLLQKDVGSTVSVNWKASELITQAHHAITLTEENKQLKGVLDSESRWAKQYFDETQELKEALEWMFKQDYGVGFYNGKYWVYGNKDESWAGLTPLEAIKSARLKEESHE